MYKRSKFLILFVLLASLALMAFPAQAGQGVAKIEVYAEPGETVYVGSEDGLAVWVEETTNDYGQTTVWVPLADIKHRFWSASGVIVIRDLKKDRSAVCLREGGCILVTWLPPRPEGPRPGGGSDDSEVLIPGPSISPLPTPKPPAQGSCTDTDGGLNYEVVGWITVRTPGNPTITARDHCRLGQLVERYCNGSDGKSVIVSCLSGTSCQSGACLPSGR